MSSYLNGIQSNRIPFHYPYNGIQSSRIPIHYLNYGIPFCSNQYTLTIFPYTLQPLSLLYTITLSSTNPVPWLRPTLSVTTPHSTYSSLPCHQQFPALY
uniref:Ovule protein n=1 Tax=Caenorhabditis tropicalis TaxID=1561998 RepID=A0A1I7U5D9_9PELO